MCLLNTTVRCAKTAEPIGITFGEAPKCVKTSFIQDVLVIVEDYGSAGFNGLYNSTTVPARPKVSTEH